MTPQPESALESCQLAAARLREIHQLVLVPGTARLAQWETELGQVAALLETLHQTMTSGSEAAAPSPKNPALQQTLQEIRRMAGTLKTQFEHGSNYCMGLLQLRSGTGYSEHGLPVLTPSQGKSSFEG